MSTGSIIVLTGIVSAFLLFAAVLMWADRYSYKPHSQAADADRTSPPRSLDRLAV